jgi:hypothetical protein
MQPMLPMTFDKTEKRTHYNVWNGTVDLYASIDVRTGKVITSILKMHTTEDFLRLIYRQLA